MHFICILNKKPYLCTHKTITSRSGAVGSSLGSSPKGHSFESDLRNYNEDKRFYKPFYPHFFNSHQGQKKMFAQIMFVQIASTLPPPLHIPLFIGIKDAVEATQKCGSKICFHTVSQTEILTPQEDNME